MRGYEIMVCAVIVCAASQAAAQPHGAASEAAHSGVGDGASADAASAGMLAGGTAGQGHSAGPYVNRAAIPSGDPGVADFEIRRTGERPAESDGVGAFRTVCAFSHMNFDDPIVFPGKPGAAHLHAYFGNTGANAFSTAASLRYSGNSTCRGGIANRSAYWVPALLDAEGTPQTPDGANIYYKTGYQGIEPETIRPFPAGMRMIAGDAKSSAGQEHAYWGCQDHYAGHLASIPDCYEGDRVVMTVVFPQCWDGIHLDSADHKSHMAYPVDGACPDQHPIPIPQIAFNISYPVPSQGTGGWHLSSDVYDPSLPGGYSAHGDWFEAWDLAVAKVWILRCNNAAMDCHSHLLGDGRELYYDREP